MYSIDDNNHLTNMTFKKFAKVNQLQCEKK